MDTLTRSSHLIKLKIIASCRYANTAEKTTRRNDDRRRLLELNLDAHTTPPVFAIALLSKLLCRVSSQLAALLHFIVWTRLDTTPRDDSVRSFFLSFRCSPSLSHSLLKVFFKTLKFPTSFFHFFHTSLLFSTAHFFGYYCSSGSSGFTFTALLSAPRRPALDPGRNQNETKKSLKFVVVIY